MMSSYNFDSIGMPDIKNGRPAKIDEMRCHVNWGNRYYIRHKCMS